MSDAAPRDHFAPPNTAVLVGCLHCREIYESYLIWFDESRGGPKTTDGREGFWTCPTEGCGGIGFTFDIWPVDPDYLDEETGEPLWTDDGSEDDDEDDWDENPEAWIENEKSWPGDPPPGGAPPRTRPPRPDGPGPTADDFDDDDVPW